MMSLFSPKKSSKSELGSPNLPTKSGKMSSPPLLRSQHPQKRSGLKSTWRLAVSKRGNAVYSTNNAGAGEYSKFLMSKGGVVLEKTVQCQYLWNIRGITVDDEDNIYLSGDHKIQKYDKDGKLVASYGWYEPGCTLYQCNDPNGLCYSQDTLYVCDSNNKRILVLSENLEYVSCIDNLSCLQHPEDIDVDDQGCLHVVDSGSLSAIKFDSDRKFLQSVDLPEKILKFPVSLRIIDNSCYYVSDFSKSIVVVLSLDGEILQEIPIKSSEEIMEDVDGFVHVDCGVNQRPIGIAVDNDGHIYVSNIDGKEIQIFR